MSRSKTAGNRTSESGWLNVQLSDRVNAKMREMAAKTRLTFTAIVENGIEREYDAWKATGWRDEGVGK